MNNLMNDIFGAYVAQDLIDSLAGDPEMWQFVDYNLRNYYGKLIFRAGKWRALHSSLYNNGSLKRDDVFIGLSKDYSGDAAFGYALPLFILWYFDHCGSFVKESVEGFYSETRSKAYTLAQSRKIVWRASLHSGDWPREYGMFGGATKSIVDMLWGEPDAGCVFEKHLVNPPNMELRSANIARMYWYSVMNRLMGGSRGVLVGEYMRRHALYSLNEKNLDSQAKDVSNKMMEFVCDCLKEGNRKFIQNVGEGEARGRRLFLMTEKQIIDDVKNKVWPAFMSDVLEECLVKAGRI